jgi:hypothetical protein
MSKRLGILIEKLEGLTGKRIILEIKHIETVSAEGFYQAYLEYTEQLSDNRRKEIKNILPNDLAGWKDLVSQLKRAYTFKEEGVIKWALQNKVDVHILDNYIIRNSSLKYNFVTLATKPSLGEIIQPFFEEYGISLPLIGNTIKGKNTTLTRALYKLSRQQREELINSESEKETENVSSSDKLKDVLTLIDEISPIELEKYADKNFDSRLREVSPENIREWMLWKKQLKRFFSITEEDIKKQVKEQYVVDSGSAFNSKAIISSLVLQGEPFKHSFLETITVPYGKGVSFFHWFGIGYPGIKRRYDRLTMLASNYAYNLNEEL